MEENKIVVGSIVRAKRGSKRSRAMVATVTHGVVASETLDREKASYLLLWEPIYPLLISDNFLITPRSIQKEAEREETIMGLEMIDDLLSFEKDVLSGKLSSFSKLDKDRETIDFWKEKGDQLLRLGDASAATSFYEKALFNSSLISIGGSVILSIGGFPRVADVDCCEEDGSGTIDVTFLHNDEEQTVQRSSVLLGIMSGDDDHLQERILLNLARCMLQLSDLDLVNKAKYLKAAILAASLVLTLLEFKEEGPSVLSPHAQTALVLRCKAYTGLSKWKNALSDARKLVQNGTDAEQGKKLLATIERKKKIQAKSDKKLAKEICVLVQSATEASKTPKTSSVSRTSADSTPTSSSMRPSAQEKEPSSPSYVLYDALSDLFHSGFVVYCVVPLLVLVLASKITGATSVHSESSG